MNVNEIKSYYQDNGKWKECKFLSGEEMTQRATELLKENERLHNRIDKAIEYIDTNMEKQVDWGFEYNLDYKELLELKNILKGSDNNE